ncbi:MAG: SMEK domain-containing protein, partial [Nitrososphaerales archaeon]
MNQADAIDKISKALTNLTSQLTQENLAGFYSKNRLLEDLLLPIFAIIFKAPSLRNLNTLGQNEAFLDLGDDKARIGFQVTTEHNAEKITKTLRGIVEARLYKQYDRIVVFILQAKRPQFKKKTKDQWGTICGRELKFAPKSDIVALPQLLALVGSGQYSEISAVEKILSKSIVGEEYVDVLAAARSVTESHLSYEKRTARYIPGVFIETRETKQLCRCFCLPVLFFRRSLEIADRLNLSSWNSFLDQAGVPPLPVPDFAAVSWEPTLLGVQAASSKVCESFEPIRNKLESYKALAQRGAAAETIPASKRPFFEENRHVLVNELPMVRYDLKDIEEELQLASKRVFILTGHAGQGKTNLLCDLVENFLTKHEIPCAFISARELGLKQNNDLAQTVCDHIFAKKIATLEEAAELVSKEALYLQKPFVLLIDGLNEHRDIKLFGQQLETVVDLLLQYPGIKCLFSCRSEFFVQRFSKIINGHLHPDIYICEATERRLEEEEKAELVKAYFEFFSVDRTLVAEHICESLANDMLLLRFFCEVYGKRGKPNGYVQPEVSHFYREELFEYYLKG